MNWEALGAVGELLGAAAVVLTLLYLARQIADQSRALEMMRSAARLTYEQVQAARDGDGEAVAPTLMEPVIAPLYGAYEALLEARRERGTLELDLPERRVVLDAGGTVAAIEPRARLDSHRLIEEFMIAANIAAAMALEARRRPCMYRIKVGRCRVADAAIGVGIS